MEPISRDRVSLGMNRSASGLLAAAMLVLLALVGCQPADEATGTLRGEVLAGPVCPAVTDPPDPECADRAVPGAILVIERTAGGEVTRVTADENGRFEIVLAVGSYTLVPQPVVGLLGTAPPQTFEMAEAETTELLVVYDTGIR